MADAATDTSIVINHCLPVFLEAYCIFRTVDIATASYTSATKITYFIIDLYTRRTGLIDNAHDIFLDWFWTVQCHFRIIRERSYFVKFICHVESH